MDYLLCAIPGPSDVNSKQDADLDILSNNKRSKAGQTAARKETSSNTFAVPEHKSLIYTGHQP